MMGKTTKIERKFSDVGRITIPKEFRESLQIKEGQTLDVLLEYGEIILRKFDKSMLRKRVVGVVKELDSNGRINIPSEMIYSMGISQGDMVSVKCNYKKQKIIISNMIRKD